MSECIVENKSKGFWDPVPRTKTLTFTDMKKPMSIKTKDKLAVDSEVLFRRMLVVSKFRDINLDTVLQHDLATVPPSLFHDDGMMRKAVKSDLAKRLEENCTVLQTLPPAVNTAYIIDGMALLQSLRETSFTSFDDLGNQVLQNVKSLFGNGLGISCISIIFDRYDNAQSIKQSERLRRWAEIGPSYVIKGSRTVPNYRKFLLNVENKAALAAFVSEYIVSMGPSILDDQSIVLDGGFKEGEVVKKVTKVIVSNLTDLFSSQEEADTRMLLHAVHLASTYERIIIRSDDTDVLVLLLYYASKEQLGSSVYMHAGHISQFRSQRRYIPICEIVSKVGKDICQNLPAAHALTGSDTTSAFFQIGKRTAYSKLAELLKQNQIF